MASQFVFCPLSRFWANVRMAGADVHVCAPSCLCEYYNVRRACVQLTIPSPIEEILCTSLGLLGRLKSLDPTSVGLCSTSLDGLAMEFFRQTNLSKSCSSLHSRSPICSEQVLGCSGRSGPELLTELTSTVLEGPEILRLLPTGYR
jgi:hypothetical protein